MGLFIHGLFVIMSYTVKVPPSCTRILITFHNPKRNTWAAFKKSIAEYKPRNDKIVTIIPYKSNTKKTEQKNKAKYFQEKHKSTKQQQSNI